MSGSCRIEVAITTEVCGPGTGGQRLSAGTWIRTPGGEWVPLPRCIELPSRAVRSGVLTGSELLRALPEAGLSVVRVGAHQVSEEPTP